MLDLIFNRLKKNTLEYRIITRFGIIGGEGGEGWKLFQKLIIGRVGIMGGVKT